MFGLPLINNSVSTELLCKIGCQPERRGNVRGIMRETTSINRLAQESSPYLLQHKTNPVNWFAWGEEAFAEAVKRNCPVFLSVGYSTCHWCHVMEKESFESEQVAQVLNESFVAVKVDREERPEVDDLYMAVIQQLTGSGGWPMSVWLTPQGEPFFGGTYYPKEQFISLNQKISEVWQKSSEKVREDAAQLTDFLRIVNEGVTPVKEAHFTSEINHRFIDSHEQSFDSAKGGFGSAPKFPQTMNLQVLMNHYFENPKENLKEMILKTLDGMCLRGMYDHLCGGFHRYSVDENWLVPHFEKMLYDNALLIQTYCDAYRLFKRSQDLQVACETADYILREMTDSEGGFYSAQDADSLVCNEDFKEEGYFCTYTFDELKENLDEEELKALKETFDVSNEGNFEGRIILSLKKSSSWEDKNSPAIQSSFLKLKSLRLKRQEPHKDDKVITAWNGLAISALAQVYMVTQDVKYLEAAKRAALFIKDKLYKENTLHRTWRAEVLGKAAYCDDYALLIKALIDLYQCDFDSSYLSWAFELQNQQDQLFWSEEHDLYFRDSGNDSCLISRVRDDYDGVTPSSNSQSVENLLLFSCLCEDDTFYKKAEKILRRSAEQLSKHPMSRPKMIESLDFLWSSGLQLIFNGSVSELKSEVAKAHQSFLPFKLLGWADKQSSFALLNNKWEEKEEGQLLLCRGKQCFPATRYFDELNFGGDLP